MLTVPAKTRTGRYSTVVLIVLALLLVVLKPADLSLFAAALGYALAAIGVDIATGYAGQPNFGQAAFMTIGCYGGAILQNRVGAGFLLALLGAVVVCALVATVLGIAAVRLEHLGFGIITFTFAFVVVAFATGGTLSGLTGGPNGLELPDAQLFGSYLSEPATLYGLSVVLLAIGAWLAHSYVRSRAGRATMTVKQDERVAAVLGVGTTGVKLRAFALSAALGGAGGVIVGQGAGFVTPESFPAAISVTVFGMAAFGGIGTITGPILGALFFWLVPSYIPGLTDYQSVIVGALFLAGLIVLPGGVFGSALDKVGPRLPQLPWLDGRASRGREVAAPALAEAGEPRATEDEIHELAARLDRSPPLRVAERPLLVADDVTVEFGGVRAVAGASISVREGQCHGLVGPNGAGKTTLLNALSGIVRPQHGTIALDGQRIDQLPPQTRRAHGLGRTFQNPALVADLSAIDNVKVGVYPIERWSAWWDLFGLGAVRDGERRTTAAAVEALDAVGFPRERRAIRAAELSHGEQKIVDLARALAGRPKVLLLDEPTAGLTAAEMNDFAEVLRRQRSEFGVTIVIVSHHMRFLSGLADQVTVMESGSVLAEGTFERVAQQPEVVTAFLGEYDAAF
jgi:branched-chain amino acid transport system permease protein